MSVQSLSPDIEKESTDQSMRHLARALDYAEGFWLGFVRSNIPAERRKAVSACKELLEPLCIRLIEIDLTESIRDLLPLLKEHMLNESGTSSITEHDELHVASEAKTKVAIFLYGLERSIPSHEAYPPILAYLNFYRELYREQLPCPLVLWLPEYALTALARNAPDFWAWRSGLYEIMADREEAERTFEPLQSEPWHAALSLSAEAKRERLANLRGLLADYRELGTSSHELEVQGRILHDIANILESMGEWEEARQCIEESLAISRRLDSKTEIGDRLRHLGVLAGKSGNILEAMRLCLESLELEGDSKSAMASSLSLAGSINLHAGRYDEALRYLEQALGLSRELDKKLEVAGISHNLGVLAQLQGQPDEAQKRFEESLRIEQELGYRAGIPPTLHQLGMLAQAKGDKAEARRLYLESLQVERELDDRPSMARTLHQLGELAEASGDLDEARRLYEESVGIDRELGNMPGEAVSLDHLIGLDKKEDKQEESDEHSRQRIELVRRSAAYLRTQVEKEQERRARDDAGGAES
jgi:tetratricopeptide (TPR) repeat protein